MLTGIWYSGLTRSTLWLLMAWLLLSPWHQQQLVFTKQKKNSPCLSRRRISSARTISIIRNTRKRGMTVSLKNLIRLINRPQSRREYSCTPRNRTSGGPCDICRVAFKVSSFPPGFQWFNFVLEGLLICRNYRSHSVLPCPIEKKKKTHDE